MKDILVAKDENCNFDHVDVVWSNVFITKWQMPKEGDRIILLLAHDASKDTIISYSLIAFAGSATHSVPNQLTLVLLRICAHASESMMNVAAWINENRKMYCVSGE